VATALPRASSGERTNERRGDLTRVRGPPVVRACSGRGLDHGGIINGGCGDTRRAGVFFDGGTVCGTGGSGGGVDGRGEYIGSAVFFSLGEDLLLCLNFCFYFWGWD
jgi:hypothetical protein